MKRILLSLAVLVTFALSIQPAAALEHGLATPIPAPEFAGIAGWQNTSDGKPLTMASLRGRVVLVDFWTYSCINCLRTLRMLKAWDAKYRDQGLTIVGVHAPEFAFEKDPKNVAQAIRRFGITYPVALDSELATWGAYHNQYWPAEYLVDRQGNIVATHFGEGNADVTERNIQELLDAKADIERKPEATSMRDQSPETYLGTARAAHFAGALQDGMASYTFPATLEKDGWALQGQWTATTEQLVAGRDAALRFRFTAGKVYLIMSPPAGGTGTVQVLMEGQPAHTVATDVKNGAIKIDQQRLYDLLDFKSDDVPDGLLELHVSPGVGLYAFTFGAGVAG